MACWKIDPNEFTTEKDLWYVFAIYTMIQLFLELVENNGKALLLSTVPSSL